MGRLLLPSEKTAPLTPAEFEAFLIGLWRTPVPVTITSGIITIPGTGCYTVTPESGVVDDLTGITLSTENLQGPWVNLTPTTTGHTIIIRHQGSMHLQNGADAILSTIYSGIWLRYKGSGVWFEFMPRMSVP
jgi:hypothetical protein